LLSYRFTSRQYWQIFHHLQTKGDISNIADTYILIINSKLPIIIGKMAATAVAVLALAPWAAWKQLGEIG
jgi:hypothetical protein